jgi:hypothetical protein
VTQYKKEMRRKGQTKIATTKKYDPTKYVELTSQVAQNLKSKESMHKH